MCGPYSGFPPSLSFTRAQSVPLKFDFLGKSRKSIISKGHFFVSLHVLLGEHVCPPANFLADLSLLAGIFFEVRSDHAAIFNH